MPGSVLALHLDAAVWLVSGVFTANWVRLVAVRGLGTTRRPVVEAIDASPGQQAGEFGVSARSLRTLAP